jgi:hypothetical protein
MNPETPSAPSDNLLADISQIIEQARVQVQRSVNSAMVLAYWHIGCRIVEQEQQGKSRTAYGAGQLQHLASQLTARYGKGFDISNLRNMRRLFQAFPIRETLSLELS